MSTKSAGMYIGLVKAGQVEASACESAPLLNVSKADDKVSYRQHAPRLFSRLGPYETEAPLTSTSREP